jgi:aryl-alcohol dehydrogenase-like predicted oxidoreductase
MKLERLGSEGPEISVVGFGAWEAGGMAWGENPPDEQTIEAMRTALDSGMNWIDTAEVYGGGRSEELIAEALSDRPEAMIFTKVAPSSAGTGFEPDQVRAAAEKSLQRLRRDRIDLYQLHWRDNDIPVERTWEAMAGLVEEGLVRYIGVSNFDEDLIRRCEKIRHVDSLQNQFNMLDQDGRDDLFPFCRENGTGILAYGPLAYGLLTGRFDENTTFGDDDWRSGKHGMSRYYESFFAPSVFKKNLDIVDALKPVAERVGATSAQLALAWIWHQEPVTAAIAGSRSPKHVEQNAGAGSVHLSPEDLAEMGDILGA